MVGLTLLSALILFFCSKLPNNSADRNDPGSANISISIGKVGSLGKIRNIELSKLYLTLSAPGETTIRDSFSLSGNAGGTYAKTYSNLASLLKTWKLAAESKDIAGNTIHFGSTQFIVPARRIIPVTLNLSARFSMLKANYFPIRDSVTRCELLVNGTKQDDSSFAKQALIGDTVRLSYNYLDTGVAQRIKLNVYGTMWGFDTLMYSGDTLVTPLTGANASYNIVLKWVGPALPPPGQVTMTVVLGAVGSITINGQLDDSRDIAMRDAFILNNQAHAKIEEWLKTATIEDARNNLMQFLDSQQIVRTVVVSTDGGVVNVEYTNGLQAVALFGTPGTLSYPGNTGISISDSTGAGGDRSPERISVASEISNYTAINISQMKDVSFTLDTLLKIGNLFNFIHIASHGGYNDILHDQFFLSGDSTPLDTNKNSNAYQNYCKSFPDKCSWYNNNQIVPDMVSHLWAVRPGFFLDPRCNPFQGSLIILSFCNSMSADSIKNVLINNKGAAAVVGWGWEAKPNVLKAQNAIIYFIKQMAENGATVFQACKRTNSYLTDQYPSGKDTLRCDGPGINTMQLSFTLNSDEYPAQGGTVSYSRTSSSYKYGEQITLTASANPGYRFKGWTGSIISSNNPIIVTMDNNKSVTANFVLKTTRTLGLGEGKYVEQTSDGGYIIVGQTGAQGAGGTDILLIKTDSDANVRWTRTFGGSREDYGSCVRQTADGFIIVGSTSSFNSDGNGYDFDLYLIKTDANGNETWEKTYGGPGNNLGSSVQQTSDGGYIIGGSMSTWGTNGLEDVYLVKTDANGKESWAKNFGGAFNDYGCYAQQTNDGGYVIAGYNSSISKWQNGDDVYLVKTDPVGAVIWERLFGDIGPKPDRAYSMQQTNDGGYIIAGETMSSGSGDWDFYLIKTNGNGEAVWTKTYGGASWDNAYSVQQTKDGGFILAGKTASFGTGMEDAYVVKTNVNGDTLWTKTYGGAYCDCANCIRETTDNGYVIIGTSDDSSLNHHISFIKTDLKGNEQ